MYGFNEKSAAEAKASQLRAVAPESRYEVAPHSWFDGLPTRLSDDSINELAAKTWGVVRYVPYCDAMPWRCDGFVWF